MQLSEIKTSVRLMVQLSEIDTSIRLSVQLSEIRQMNAAMFVVVFLVVFLTELLWNLRLFYSFNV